MEQQLIAKRYLVKKHLGHGAQATVFLATDQQTENDVAIKILGQISNDDLGLVKRFQREFSACKRFDHSNLVKIFDLGQLEDGTWYYTMEYLPYPSLRFVLNERKKMEEKEVVEILLAIADGCAHFHEQGVVHRDLKPENIVYATGGRPVIVDFGLAREEDATALTATGTMLGTPFYMAPEMVIGERADNKADIYAIGVIAFFLLTGQKPFEGEDLMALMTKIMNQKPPHVSDVNQKLSLLWDPLLDKCMAKDPELRFKSAEDLKKALRKLQDSFASHKKQKSRTTAPVKREKTSKTSITESGAVEATKISSSSQSVVSRRSSRTLLILFFLCLTVALVILSGSFQRKPIKYSVLNLQTESYPGSIVFRWNSNHPYLSLIELSGIKDKTTLHGGEKGKTTDHKVRVTGLEQEEEYSFRVLYPNKESSLVQRVKTSRLELTNLTISPGGFLSFTCPPANRVIVHQKRASGRKSLNEAIPSDVGDKWSIPISASLRDTEQLRAEVELKGGKNTFSFDLGNMLKTEAKKRLRNLLHFSEKTFLQEINEQEDFRYKQKLLKEKERIGRLPDKDWSRRTRKVARGEALLEYSQKHETKDTWLYLMNVSPFLFESKLYSYKEQMSLFRAFRNGLLISLFSCFRKSVPLLKYDGLPQMGEFSLSLGRRRRGNHKEILYTGRRDAPSFGPLRVSFYSKATRLISLSANIPRPESLAWSEIVIEVDKFHQFLIYVTINDKLELPVFYSPYLEEMVKGKKITLVQRVPLAALISGRNKIDCRASHAMDGTTRHKTKIHRITFSALKK